MTSRTRKAMEFPTAVIEAKEYFKKKDSKYSYILKKLTENKDPKKLEALKRMWFSLEAGIKKQPSRPGIPKEHWVHFFVGHAHAYSNMPKYYYQTKTQRKKLVDDLKKLTGRISKKLKDNKLDLHLAHSERQNILYFYERLDFLDNHQASKSLLERPTITEMLTRLVQSLENEVASLRKSRTDSYEAARLFVHGMGKYLKDVHGACPTTALATATNAIFRAEYIAADIHHILKR